VIKSIVALIGSFAIYVFVLLALTLVAALVFGTPRGAPTIPFLALRLAVAALSALAAGFSCAALAPGRPRAHVAGLAAMILVTHLSAVLKPPAGQPRWDPAAHAVIVPLVALAGGLLRRPRPSPIQA
jgi:hypothetical protein